MDQLEKVKKGLGKHDSKGFALIAEFAKVSTRTLYNVMDKDSNPRYKTVLAILDALKCVSAK